MQKHWRLGSWAVRSNRLAVFCCLIGLTAYSWAEGQAPFFKGADLDLGQRLLKEHQCQACHMSKVGGDGTGIYNPLGRINTAPFLRGMVEQCNTQMGLGLFPDEVHSIAAVLNRDFYKFKD